MPNLDFEKKYTTANGSEPCASIVVRYIGSTLQYLAVTLTKSATFKTLNNAEKFMARNGYKAI